MPVGLPWTGDSTMHASHIAFAAILIAAVACTDATSPAASSDSLATARRFRNPRVPAAAASSTAPASLYSGYSPTSPHWSHITTMMTDFYYGWAPTERAWAGAHYDLAMSGSGSAWREVNPTVRHIPYALLWTTIAAPSTPNLATGYYADMKSWFGAHPQYALEKVFLHQIGATLDSAHRAPVTIWGSKRWAINPYDAGAIAYSVDRLQRVSAGESGVFLDETATGSWGNYLKATREVPTSASYSTGFASLLAAVRRGLGTKMIMLNTSAYQTAADRIDAVAAGAVHLELDNDFKYSGMIERWKWIESLNASGIFVDFVSAHSSPAVTAMGSSYPRGNSATSAQRAKLWELASYYLAISASPKLLALQLENSWSNPYSTLWVRAQEANIGHPLASRVQTKIGVDPLGNSYILYTREFDRALVVLRLQQGWNAHSYIDGTAITYSLPSGQTWLPLNADGTVGTPATSIRLRNSEAAILLKSSTM
jgi:hypothetical protein